MIQPVSINIGILN